MAQARSFPLRKASEKLGREDISVEVRNLALNSDRAGPWSWERGAGCDTYLFGQL